MLVDNRQARISLRIAGIVQGVGFRPFVSMVAQELGLTGFVYNDTKGVYIEIEGPMQALEVYRQRLEQEAPPLSRIDSIQIEEKALEHSTEFAITVSHDEGKVRTWLSPDTAPCEACLKDMKDPNNRRYGYAFTNCTHCGPRYTIIEGIPYDRKNTSMKSFIQCEQCQAEYEDVYNRRYHAEPNACPQCGPHYQLYALKSSESHNAALDFVANGNDSIQQARELIESGHILAVKGIGGYHLVCNGRDEEAVQNLRNRKQRPAKPLALMAGSLETAKKYMVLNKTLTDLILSPARPIVLAPKVAESDLAPSVAPQTSSLGIMLPYAPVHYELLKEDSLWVMTSANRSGEPMLHDDERVEDLVGIADYVVTHNRQIVSPVDDSLVTAVDDKVLMYRRSRGYVPLATPVKSLGASRTLLAMGGDLKNAFAMNVEDQVLLGPHIGDLVSLANESHLEEQINRYQSLFELEPMAVVIDKNPMYVSSRLGRTYAEKYGIPLLEVQHHKAHVASVVAEYDLQGKVLGISFDGTGYGDDGTIWGGEFFYGEDYDYKRVAHIGSAPLFGGDAAAKEPWRQALWYLQGFYGKDISNLPMAYSKWTDGLPQYWEMLWQMMEKAPHIESTSAGRLFDTVASLLGLGYAHSYEAQIAMTLESMAVEQGRDYGMVYQDGVLQTEPLVYQLIEAYEQGESVTQLASDFHRTLAQGIIQVVNDLVSQYEVDYIVLAGGVFQNKKLLELILRGLPSRVYIPSTVPLNDGGLALGQLYLGHKQLYK